ncbi:hypothetical protein A6R68_07652 [Neotoma lepida]|uniref:polynucleotide adenylyltransferase n=1 Tax=Neotoma lepida TaxID=56216 RepID=A0A1A6GD81_NEOLE|nr:hypothetical protein A6R68_07652 [Neotoma lepida]
MDLMPEAVMVIYAWFFFLVKEKTESQHVDTLVHKPFCTRLSGYIERPYLIHAKVPIVKFRTYAYLENRVHLLVLVIKKWESQHEINYTSLGILMVLYYFQSYLKPSLQKIYTESFSTSIHLHLVNNVPPYLTKKESSLGDLLLGFFKYYGIELEHSDFNL